MSPAAEAAVIYAQHGRRVFPAHPVSKRPLVRWSSVATSDPERVAAIFRAFPTALVGLCTGDGLVVVDDDRGLAKPDPSLVPTLTARTRSRGWHHYYLADEPVPCSVSKVAPGIDIRGDGGYVIAPPSNGWEWHNPGAVIKPLPGQILSAIRAHAASPSSGPAFEPAGMITEGGRNDYIARFVGWAIRTFEIEDFDDLLELTNAENQRVCRPELGEAEVRRTARSILTTHERRLRG